MLKPRRLLVLVVCLTVSFTLGVQPLAQANEGGQIFNSDDDGKSGQDASKTTTTITTPAATGGTATGGATGAATTTTPAATTTTPATNTAAGGNFAAFIKQLGSVLSTILSFLGEILKAIFGVDNAQASTPGTATGATVGTSTGTSTGTVTTTLTGTGTGTPTTGADSGELAAYKGGKLSPAKFFALFGPAARASAKATGVPASVSLAQAALETGWGKSTIGDAKNLFGIKGTGPAGSIRVPTKEVIRGQRVTVMAHFRKYTSWQQSINDHAKLLTTKSRYAKAMQYKSNPQQFIREVHRAGYATDPNYANTVISIMNKYNLAQYDK